MTHAEAKPSLYRNVRIHPSARLSPAAGIVGDVTIGRDSCVLAGAQIRADDAPVIIGDEVNIQENAVVHVDRDHPAILHDHCTIGHGAIIHGCEIGPNALVGMGAIVMNGAKVGANCVVAAGALVSEDKELPDGSLVMGMPARVNRTLSDEEIARLCTAAGDEYLAVGARMLEEGLLHNPEPSADAHLGF